MFAVITQHGADREVRTVAFADFDEAVAYARANDPDTDGSLCPNVDDVYAQHPRFEKGVYWLRNLYAVVIREVS